MLIYYQEGLKRWPFNLLYACAMPCFLPLLFSPCLSPLGLSSSYKAHMIGA